MRNISQLTVGLFLLLALCLTAQAQTVAKREAESTTKQTVEFGAQGTIQIVDSFGSVKVEGWDKDEVELTFTKRTQKKYAPKDLAKAARELERLSAKLELVEENTLLVLNTTYASRTLTRLWRGKTNLNLDYLIKVPRQCTLQIKHDIGEVHVTGVAGDIEATARIGEFELQLPAEQNYAVDARVRIGDVSSEFGQATQRQGMFSVGAKLADAPSVRQRRVFVRLGIGDIQVSKLRAEKPEEVK
jgi:hypothetical protein